MPFFSVIIPLFNKAPYIRRALDSVLGQTFKDYEIIVVDDGSTDDGPAIVASYSDSRIRLLHQENSGPNEARNRGIKESRAEWLAFLDADDEYFFNFLDKMHSEIVKNQDIGFAFSNYLYTGIDGCTRKMTKKKNYKKFHVIENYCDFLYENSLNGASASSIIINKSVLYRAGCFPVNTPKAGDIDTWMRLGWISKAGYEPSCLAHYHNEVLGTSWIHSDGSHPIRRYPVGPEILISSYNEWKQKGIFPERMERSWRRCLTGYSLCHVREWIQFGDKKTAWRFFLKELKLDGWWKERGKILMILLLPSGALYRLKKYKEMYWTRLKSYGLNDQRFRR